MPLKLTKLAPPRHFICLLIIYYNDKTVTIVMKKSHLIGTAEASCCPLFSFMLSWLQHRQMITTAHTAGSYGQTVHTGALSQTSSVNTNGSIRPDCKHGYTRGRVPVTSCRQTKLRLPIDHDSASQNCFKIFRLWHWRTVGNGPTMILQQVYILNEC